MRSPARMPGPWRHSERRWNSGTTAASVLWDGEWECWRWAAWTPDGSVLGTGACAERWHARGAASRCLARQAKR